ARVALASAGFSRAALCFTSGAATSALAGAATGAGARGAGAAGFGSAPPLVSCARPIISPSTRRDPAASASLLVRPGTSELCRINRRAARTVALARTAVSGSPRQAQMDRLFLGAPGVAGLGVDQGR